MKHKLLSLIALAGAMLTSTSVFAQVELEDPVAPTRPAYPAVESNWVTPEAGGTYYIYNVGSGQFLGCGLNWGTRAVTTIENLIKLSDATWTCSENKNTIIPFQISVAEGLDVSGDWFYITHLNTNKVPNDIYLCHEGNESWIDGGTGRRDSDNNGCWSIEATEDGAYILRPMDYVTLVDEEGTPILDGDGNEQTVLTTNSLGLHNTNMGDKTSYTWTDRPNDATSYVTWKFLDANAPEDVEAILNDETVKTAYQALLDEYNVQKKIYEAKLVLKDAIIEAEDAGYSIDEALTIFNKADATLKEVLHATGKLKADMVRDNYDFSGASNTNPLDVTDQVLINPTFDSNIDGWTITVTGQNLQWQQRTDGQVDSKKNWVRITNFIEAWISSSSNLGDGTISQTVYGLPAGKYVLECDAMATRQGGLNGLSAEDAVEGAYIFIEGEDSEIRTPIKAPDTQPKHWEVVFTSDGSNYLTFGLKVENTTANWISADNFKLTYYGETTETQAQMELSIAITKAKNLKEEKDGQGTYEYCYTPTRTAFEKAITDAEAAYKSGSDDETCIAQTEALKEAQSKLESSYEAYLVLKSYLDKKDGGQGLLNYYWDITDECGMDELAETLEGYMETWPDAYYAGTMSDEEILEKTAAIQPALRENLNPENISEGADLTWLLVNADFSQGNGRDLSGDAVPGWTVKSGNLTELRSSTGNIEKYHGSFDMSQTISNMPAGAYEITVQGFVRHDDANVTNGTIFYAGNTETHLMTLETQWSLEPIWAETTQEKPELGDANHDLTLTTPAGETGYKANGMTGAYYWFKTPIKDATDFITMPAMDAQGNITDNFYTNHILVTLYQDGDFTIGLKSTVSSDWVIWDNFQIKFRGMDVNAFKQQILSKVEDLEKAHAATTAEGDPIYITQKGQDIYEAAVANGKTVAQTVKTTEEFRNAVEQLDAAIAYINEGGALAIDLEDLLGEYDELRIDNIASPDYSDFRDYLDAKLDLFKKKVETDENEEVITSYVYKTRVADNEALAAMPEEVGARWTQFIMAFTQDNPYDDGTNFGNATEAIYNPRYNGYADDGTYSVKGWSIEVPDSITNTNEFRAADAVAQTYNFPYFKVSQTVKGLTTGWYLITVDGFYRPGLPSKMTTEETANEKNVNIFGESSFGIFETPIMRVMKHAQEGKLEIENGTESAITIDGITSYIPNNTVAAYGYINQLLNTEVSATPAFETIPRYNSLYRNDLFARVGEDGVLTIGLTNHAKSVEGDWTVFTNWTLTYLGTETPDGIQSATTKSANGIVNIYTIDGRQAQRLQRGINIVRTTDGSVQKVLVK